MGVLTVATASPEYVALSDVPHKQRTRRQWLRMLALLRTYEPPHVILKITQLNMARWLGLVTRTEHARVADLLRRSEPTRLARKSR